MQGMSSSQTSSPDNPSRKARGVKRLDGWRLIVLFPLAVLMRIWAATLRFELSGRAAAAAKTDGPMVIAFWHNRLFVISELYRRANRNRRVCGLVSASKDGAWLVAFFKLMGVGAVRGSSSWRGAQAMRELIRVVREGNDIGITPDGPRGPCYDFKSGAAAVATRAGAPVCLLSINFQRGRRLNSWDGFYLPGLFSKVEVDVDLLAPVEMAEVSASAPETAASLLQARLMAITSDQVEEPPRVAQVREKFARRKQNLDTK